MTRVKRQVGYDLPIFHSFKHVMQKICDTHPSEYEHNKFSFIATVKVYNALSLQVVATLSALCCFKRRPGTLLRYRLSSWKAALKACDICCTVCKPCTSPVTIDHSVFHCLRVSKIQNNKMATALYIARRQAWLSIILRFAGIDEVNIHCLRDNYEGTEITASVVSTFKQLSGQFVKLVISARSLTIGTAGLDAKKMENVISS
jgi:hypothetical protein